MRRIEGILDRRWFSNAGPVVKEFEQRIQQLLGVRHCIAMCNGTVALEIAIRALGLKDEVIVPSYTFIATAHALQWQGITPVFADIDPATHNLDPHAVEARITPRTTGIIGVHLWGRPCADGRLAGTRRPARPGPDVRCLPRLQLHARRETDRQLRPCRGVQLPRHQVPAHLRRVAPSPPTTTNWRPGYA
jgi:hypothetical protein